MNYYSDYIIETFKSVYKIDPSINLSYGNSDSKISVQNKAFDYFNSEFINPPDIVWKKWLGIEIPFLFDNDNTLPIISYSESSAVVNYDIIGSAFFFLGNWQELDSTKRDNMGRYPFKESLQSQYNFAHLPVVNYYFDILKTAIEHVEDVTVERKLWNRSSFAVSVSHDIDKINSGWIEGSASALKKGRVDKALKGMLLKVFKKDPWDNLNDILELENQLQINSTFFFLTKKGNGNADYQFDEVSSYFRKIRENTSEVALHGCLNSYKDPEILKREAGYFDQKIKGLRFHFLKYDPTSYSEVLDQTGLEYDSSSGFAEHIGFRNGYCFPFRPFNHTLKKASNFISIPLVIMDATLRNKNYMDLQLNSLEQIRKITDEVENFGGLLTILWHNNYFSDFKFEGWSRLFINIINDLKSRGASFHTCEQISNTYKGNSGKV